MVVRDARNAKILQVKGCKLERRWKIVKGMIDDVLKKLNT